MDGGAWKAAVHGVAKSRTRLSYFTFTFHFSRIGEGNGNPLQCSCLENPRDGGAWWAAVYGVAQSRTRLRRLSSSSAVLSRSVMFDSLQPHRLYPSRLLCPWDSPGKHWNGLPCPPPGDLPNPGIKPRSPTLQADSSSESQEKPKHSIRFH